jgi:hypothetical protein
MDARTVLAPSWASLAGQAGAEGAHPRSRSTLDVPSGSGPEVREPPSPPLLGLSGPRFERIEGMEEGTG